MSDKPTSWMPFWLATYIFLITFICVEAASSLFCVWAYENNLEYVWYIGAAMCATVALPWVWYFTYLAHQYLAHQYLDTIPRLCYLWIFAPFIIYIYRVLELETLYSCPFTFDGITYFIYIGWEVIILPAIAIVVWHELRTHRAKYINFLWHVREATNV